MLPLVTLMVHRWLWIRTSSMSQLGNKSHHSWSSQGIHYMLERGGEECYVKAKSAKNEEKRKTRMKSKAKTKEESPRGNERKGRKR